MLYPLGWLPPEVTHSNDANLSDGPRPTESQANPKWAQLSRVLRTSFPSPRVQVTAKRPALSDRFTPAKGSRSDNSFLLAQRDTTAPELTLKFGDQNQNVKVAQSQLQALGYYSGPVDGIFGPLTKAAVNAFQKDNGVTVDGIVGELTWQQLNQAAAAIAPDVKPTPAPEVKPALTSPLPQPGSLAVSQPETSSLIDGPVFTPALVPNLSFHPIAVSPVPGHTKLFWVTILTLTAAGGVTFFFKPDPQASLLTQPRTSPKQSKVQTIHQPQAIYPKVKKSPKHQVIHRPQPIYPPGYKPAHGPTKLDSSAPTQNLISSTDEASSLRIPELPQDLSQLFQKSPWAIQAQEDYLTSFLYDLQEADSRKQLEGLVALVPPEDESTPRAEPLAKIQNAPSVTPIRRLGSFPERNRRTGQPYTYMLVDDMGGCFCLRNHELWLTESAVLWLTSDEPYTLTIRRIDTSGVTVDKAFTVTLNTYQMQMAS